MIIETAATATEQIPGNSSRTATTAARPLILFPCAKRHPATPIRKTPFGPQQQCGLSVSTKGPLLCVPTATTCLFLHWEQQYRLATITMQVSRTQGRTGIFESKILSPGGRRILPGGLFRSSLVTRRWMQPKVRRDLACFGRLDHVEPSGAYRPFFCRKGRPGTLMARCPRSLSGW